MSLSLLIRLLKIDLLVRCYRVSDIFNDHDCGLAMVTLAILPQHGKIYPGSKQVRRKKWDTNISISKATKKLKPVAHYHCPVEATLDVIGGKWKVLILYWLRDQVCRFGELRRKIPDISERMLTQQLRELESHGIVHRKVYPVVPPKVEYSLTAYGQTLRPINDLMCAWGKKHMRRIEEAD